MKRIASLTLLACTLAAGCKPGDAASEPRNVPRGATPEIVVKGSQIFVNRKAVALGGPLSDWVSALPTPPKCRSEKNDITLCIWEELGIAVGTSLRDTHKAKFLNITINVEPIDPLFPERPRPFRPKSAFPGYLELDGYGIDAKTKFWEIRAAADPKRNLRCNTRDCSHAHGGFSDKANLYLRLNGATEHNNLYEFTIAADEESPSSASTPK